MNNRLSFSESERGQIAASLAVAAARNDHQRAIELLDEVPAEAVTPTVERYRMSIGLAARAWAHLARWTARKSSGGVSALRWQYWRARALIEHGDEVAANKILKQLATERDYYGYLAADHLDLPYALNQRAVAPSTAEMDNLLATPGIPRARELYLLDNKYQARREWAFETGRMSVRQLEVAARLAADWGWPDSAISALGKAKSYDDLDVRFPLLYAEHARNYAERREISAARIMAIMRSESAFVVDARSGAGALGLMQLMPARHEKLRVERALSSLTCASYTNRIKTSL